MSSFGCKWEPSSAKQKSSAARNFRRATDESETLTELLACKPLDVELRRLQRAALRRLKNKGKR